LLLTALNCRLQPKLDEMLHPSIANREVTNNVAITGYADRIGSNQYNLKLSERRSVGKRLLG
jgi:OOP family OmpA-OmpF porin